MNMSNDGLDSMDFFLCENGDWCVAQNPQIFSRETTVCLEINLDLVSV
jgi:hypothetical protein